VQKFEDDQLARRYSYTPGGATGAWANFRSPYEYDVGMVDGSVTSVSGQNVFMPNLRAIADLYRENPQSFTQDWGANGENFFQSYVARRRRYNEKINAGFLMGTGSWQKLTGRLGLRWEETHTDASEADARRAEDVRAAGFPIGTGALTGRAITIPGLEYQYLSRPRIHRLGNYDNFFPSGSLKYRLSRSFDVHFGYSSTIRRPSYVDLAGVRLINDTSLTVTTPNVGLKPETSENYATRLAYYFEPVGLLAMTFTQRDVTDLIVEERINGQEFGLPPDDELANYEFVTKYNTPGQIRIRSMEFEYSQTLSFLGDKFKRLSARLSYTRLYPEVPRPNLTPHLASGGLNYTLGKLNDYGNWNWSDNVPTNVAGTTFRRHRTNVDAGAGWRLTSRYSLAVSVRNIADTPYINMQRFANGAVAMTRNETVGQSWTFAVKGMY